MGTYGAILPGAGRLARLPAELSPEAKRRLQIIQWCEEHGDQVRLTARHFGFSPDTISRWRRAYRERGLAGLEPRSRRPRRTRTPTTPPDIVQRIQQLREQYPRWGREKLRVLLEREGITVSAKTIDRTIARLKRRGILREPLRSPAARRTPRPRLRRPRDLVPDAPGVLVQLDTKQLNHAGRRSHEFAAIDCFTRKRVVAVAPSLKSRNSAAFLQQLVERFPFPVQAVQTDGGSEFKDQFGRAVQALGIPHYVTAPYHPQSNGRVERAFRTDEDEFYQVEDLPSDLRSLDAALQRWNHVYEAVRPHQALDYLTPDEFYNQWLTNARKEAVSDMS